MIFRIGDLVQPKGRPDKAGIITSIDNSGVCGKAHLRFLTFRAHSRAYSLANLEPAEPEAA